MGFTRERSPFVFTKAMKFCISQAFDWEVATEGRGQQMIDKSWYPQFLEWCEQAYNSLRERYRLLISLLTLVCFSINKHFSL